MELSSELQYKESRETGRAAWSYTKYLCSRSTVLTVYGGVYDSPLERFSRLYCSTTKRVLIPNDTSSESSRRDDSNADRPFVRRYTIPTTACGDNQHGKSSLLIEGCDSVIIHRRLRYSEDGEQDETYRFFGRHLWIRVFRGNQVVFVFPFFNPPADG